MSDEEKIQIAALGLLGLFGRQQRKNQEARKEAERQEAERQEAERQEAERQGMEQEEKRQREAERQEAERREAERREAERQEAERREAERREAERREAERREAERREAERREAERRESERREAERQANIPEPSSDSSDEEPGEEEGKEDKIKIEKIVRKRSIRINGRPTFKYQIKWEGLGSFWNEYKTLQELIDLGYDENEVLEKINEFEAAEQEREENEQRQKDEAKDENKLQEGQRLAGNIRLTKDKELIEAIETVFDQIDKKQTGVIDRREFIKSIRNDQVVQNIFLINKVKQEDGSRAKIEKIFQAIDIYPEDSVWSREEFLIYMFEDNQSDMLDRVKQQVEATKDVFDTFDENENGVITATELVPAYEINGMAKEDAEQAVTTNLNTFDKDGDRAFNFSEFWLWVVSTNPVWLRSMMQDAILSSAKRRIQAMRNQQKKNTILLKDKVDVYKDMLERDRFRKELEDTMVKVRKELDELSNEAKEIEEKKSEVSQVVPASITEEEQQQQGEILQEVDTLMYELLDRVVELEKKTVKKKKSAKKDTTHHANKAKKFALGIMEGEGVRKKEGEFVEYIVNKDNAVVWEGIITDIENHTNKQAFYVLYQAIVKGLYQLKTYEDDNISLNDLKKILKPGGEKYYKDYIKVTAKGRETLDQKKTMSIVKLIIKDLKNGDDFFKKYIDGGSNPRNPRKPKKKKKKKAKTPDNPSSLPGLRNFGNVPVQKDPQAVEDVSIPEDLPAVGEPVAKEPVDNWGKISKAAQNRIEDLGYNSLDEFLLKISKEEELEAIKKPADFREAAAFLSRIRRKKISGKQGIIEELGLTTKKAEAEEKERKQEEELKRKRIITKIEVKKRFEKLKQNKGDIAISQEKPRQWRQYAEKYAEEEGFTTDGISKLFQQMMAILYEEKQKNKVPKTPKLFAILRQPDEPRLRF